MNNEELKKKICKIIADNYLPKEMPERLEDYKLYRFARAADALIAAGVVDKSDYASMKETAVSYKAEVSKAEAREKEAEHRAEVAERALYNCCFNSLFAPFGIQRPTVDELYDAHLKTAEKELAEEWKDD